MPREIDRGRYAALYGPTVGDRARLADTDLLIQVEEDRTLYGEEVKFGGGKTIRDGMGQSATATDVPDLVITNALILDHWGIVKADVGVKDGLIRAIGKAGNPDIMDGVDPLLVIGVGTDIIAGEGLILTAGGIDAHIHFIAPQQIEHAIASGITTMLGGGTGPSTGTNATTCTPGRWNLARMLQAADAYPVNLGFLGKGNATGAEGLREQIRAGAIGLKLHEDWGSTPAAIDTCLWRSIPTRSTRPGSSKTRFAPSAGERSTPTIPREPAVATRRTSSRWLVSRIRCRRRPIRLARSPSTPFRSTWTC